MIRVGETFRTRLDAVSVFDWTSSPLGAVFWRELLVALRYQRYALLLGGLSLALIAAIFYNLARLAAGLIAPAEVVTNIIGLQCGALLLVLFLVIPALSAVTVAAEQYQETGDLLHMALNEPLSLLAGKLLAMLAIFSVFHLALLPFSVFTYFFAGIEVRSFFQISFMLYGTALCHSIMGVAVSRAVARPGRALFWVYTALFLLYVLPSWLSGQSILARPLLAGATISWYLTPIPLLRDLLHSLAGWKHCFQFLGMQMLGALLFAGGCALATQLAPLARHFRPGHPEGKRLAPVRPPLPPVPDWANAIYHKDRHTIALARPGWSAATFAAGLIAALAFTAWSARYLNLSITAVEGGTAVLILITPLLVLERSSKEMASDSLLMLRLTRLSSEQVLLGKITAVIRCLLPLCLGILLGGILLLPFVAPGQLTGGHPDTPTPALLIYQAILLPVKLIVLTVLCFACVRFRNPNATDLAITLVASTLLASCVEAFRIGFFETADLNDLSPTHLAILIAFQFFVATVAGSLLFMVSLMRFETVFDEGSDIYATRHIDRGGF